MEAHRLLAHDGPWLHVIVGSDSEVYDQLRALEKTPARRIVVRMIRGHKAGTEEGLFNEFAAALQFPPYFGENWDALEECLGDLEWLPAEAYVLAICHASALLTREPAEQLPLFVNVLHSVAQGWNTPTEGEAGRPPIAFHVVLQCAKDEEATLRKRLQSTGVAWNVLT